MKELHKLIRKEIKKALKETAAKPHDMEKIQDFIMSAPEFESTSPTKLKKAVGEMYEEWVSVASNYNSIEEYFEEIEQTGGLEAFLPENIVKEDAAFVGQIALGVAGGLAGLWALVKGGALVRNILGIVGSELGRKLEAKAKQAITDANKATVSQIIKKFEDDTKLTDMYKTLPVYTKYPKTQKAITANKERTKQLKLIADYIKTKLTPEEMEYFKDISAMLRTSSVKLENKMNKTKMIVRRLREDTAYQEFFKKAMEKFKISSPADLKDPVRKKEFFDYVDKNYKAKDEK